MRFYGKYFFILFVFIYPLILAGCAGKTTSEELRWLDDKAGEALDVIPAAPQTPAIPEEKPTEASSTEAVASTTPAGELTEMIKNKIDSWLEANNLNRYGDATGTMYTGGTPLFNEMSGESTDRFEYILKKIPDLLEKLGNYAIRESVN